MPLAAVQWVWDMLTQSVPVAAVHSGIEPLSRRQRRRLHGAFGYRRRSLLHQRWWLSGLCLQRFRCYLSRRISRVCVAGRSPLHNIRSRRVLRRRVYVRLRKDLDVGIMCCTFTAAATTAVTATATSTYAISTAAGTPSGSAAARVRYLLVQLLHCRVRAARDDGFWCALLFCPRLG